MAVARARVPARVPACEVTTCETGSSQAPARATARFFQVLGDPTRFAIVEILSAGERTVSQLMAMTGASQSRVSNHLACLRWCRFVEGERRGRQVFYRLSDPRIEELLALGRELAAPSAEHLASCARIGPDWV